MKWAHQKTAIMNAWISIHTFCLIHLSFKKKKKKIASNKKRAFRDKRSKGLRCWCIQTLEHLGCSGVVQLCKGVILPECVLGLLLVHVASGFCDAISLCLIVSSGLLQECKEWTLWSHFKQVLQTAGCQFGVRLLCDVARLLLLLLLEIDQNQGDRSKSRR